MAKQGLAGTVRTLTAIAALATIAVGGSAFATTISLSFNSLPSAQGWTFVGFDGLTESDVFSVDGTTLKLNTIGSGSFGGGFYKIGGVLDAKLPYSIEVTARILAAEPSSGVAFGYSAESIGLYSAVVLGLGRIGIQTDGPASVVTLDTSLFHDYRLEVFPVVGSWNMLIDSVFQASGAINTASLPNSIEFGESFFGTNGEAEITRYVFEQPLQPVPLPAALPLFGAALAGLAAAAARQRRTTGTQGSQKPAQHTLTPPLLLRRWG